MLKLSLITLLSFNLFATDKFVEKTVEYKDDKGVYEGYIVHPENLKKGTPAILVIHDWLGLTEKTKTKAKELARLGYIAFAADIYGKGVRPKNADEARMQATIYKSDRKLYRERLNLAYKELSKLSVVSKDKLAAIGFCFGGTGVLELARSGANIKGVVSFHGGLDSPAPNDGKNIKGKVLALHGADDPFVSPEDLAAFEQEMRSSKIDWQLIKYGNAVHSFTDKTAGNDNSKGAAYNANADKLSWEEMKNFFKRVL